MQELTSGLELTVAIQMAVLGPFLLVSSKGGNRLRLSIGTLCMLFAVLVGANLIGGVVSRFAADYLTLFLECLLGPVTALSVLQLRDPPPALRWRDAGHIVLPGGIYLLWLSGLLSSPDLPVLTLHLSYLAIALLALAARAGYASSSSYRLAVTITGVLAAFIILKSFIVWTSAGGGAYRDTVAYNALLWLLLAASTALLLVCLGSPRALNAPRAFRTYAGDAASPGEQALIVQRIERLAGDPAFARDPELSLTRLAEAVKAPPRHVSQAVNSHFNMSVTAFLNRHRIERIKQALANVDDRRTITEIMLAEGFNSKSAFNREFRKRTGMTPTAFRQRHGANPGPMP